MYSGIDTFLVITENPKSHPNKSNVTSKFRLSKVGCPIRRSAGQRLFAPHHSLSQRTTSFIASYRQGIHQMPLGHLIALISNARHFIFVPEPPLEGRPGLPTTRQGEHCSERPEVEINPYRTAVAILRRAAHRRMSAPGVSPLYDVHYHPPADVGGGKLFSSKTVFNALSPVLVVEPDGIEPTTSCLQSTRSPS